MTASPLKTAADVLLHALDSGIIKAEILPDCAYVAALRAAPDPLDTLRKHLAKAVEDGDFHRARRDADGARQQGNVDTGIAGFKAAWLRQMIGEIEAAT